MPERAEIEAVLSAVGSPECNCRSKAEAALDRVRDARDGEDETLFVRPAGTDDVMPVRATRPPQGESDEGGNQ
jgi:hypothetical protein